MTGEALLEVDAVGKTYGMGGLLARHRTRAVDDVSFALQAGQPEIFTIIGESGSGKSTLARMISKWFRPAKAPSAFAAFRCRDQRRRERLGFMARCSRSSRTRSRRSIR